MTGGDRHEHHMWKEKNRAQTGTSNNRSKVTGKNVSECVVHSALIMLEQRLD